VFVEDVARANLLALRSERTDAFYNVGTGIGTSLRRLAEMLVRLSGVDVEIRYEPGGQTFVTQRVGAVERAREDLGFVARVTVEEGLER